MDVMLSLWPNQLRRVVEIMVNLHLRPCVDPLFEVLEQQPYSSVHPPNSGTNGGKEPSTNPIMLEWEEVNVEMGIMMIHCDDSWM
jgi:hypothetical protein